MANSSLADLDSALNLITKIYQGSLKDIDIDFKENFNISIKLEGEQWGGQIDYRIAKFILHLQEDIIKIYNTNSDDRVILSSLQNKKKDLIVTIEVRPGCTELFAKIGNVIDGLARSASTMESRHTMIAIICTALIAAGGWTANTFIEKSAEQAEKISDNEVKKQFIETMEKSADTAQQAVSSLTYIAGQMHKDDKITVGDVSYTRHDALEKFRYREPDIIPSTKPYNIDGRYQITAAYFQKKTIAVLAGTKSLTVKTNYLSESDTKKLYDIYKDADLAGNTPAVDLQITVEACEGKVVSAVALALGSPRNGSMTLAHALLENEKL